MTKIQETIPEYTTLSVTCETAECPNKSKTINRIHEIEQSSLDMFLEDWSKSSSHDDICPRCGILGTAQQEVETERISDRIPLNVKAFQAYAPHVAERNTEAYLGLMDLGTSHLKCASKYEEGACDRKVTNFGPAARDCDKQQELVFVPLCEHHQSFETGDFGGKHDARCEKCGLDTVWWVDYLYSHLDVEQAQIDGVGGLQCLACGWKYDIPSESVPALSSLYLYEESYPKLAAATYGVLFTDEGATHLLHRNKTSFSVCDYLKNVVYHDDEPIYEFNELPD